MLNQKAKYVANIARIMYADGAIVQSEEKILANICKQMKVPIKELAEIKKAAQKNKKLQPLNRFSKSITNIEDCFVMALCDGVFDANERKLIFNLAEKIELDKKNINKIFSDAAQRLKIDVNNILHEG
jgi:uncharacterized tellurite resistance protein B-like protein